MGVLKSYHYTHYESCLCELPNRVHFKTLELSGKCMQTVWS